MKLIVISRPDFFTDEANHINRLFADGLNYLHLRKPDCERSDLRKLIKCIDAAYHNRLALHEHHDLAGEFGIARLHFTERHRSLTMKSLWEALKNKGFQLSTSIHDLAQLESLSTAFSYTFFGPIFDSISKQGYRGVLEEKFFLRDDLKKIEVIAIGGIDESNIGKIKRMNFDGAAVLGAIWQSKSSLSSLSFLSSDSVGLSRRQWGAIDRFHFISNGNLGMSHLDSIRLALDAGCRWIQLRIKDQSEEDVLKMAFLAKNLCDSYAAKLVVNDSPHIAKAVNAHALHLGLNDMPLPDARKIVGNEMVIGGTANTFEDIVARIEDGADYVGLGPYRFTTTKQNLSPVLGLEGYQHILKQLKQHNYHIPIIAIGGIRQEDIAGLTRIGIHGVAMSSALTQAENRIETVLEIQKALC